MNSLDVRFDSCGEFKVQVTCLRHQGCSKPHRIFCFHTLFSTRNQRQLYQPPIQESRIQHRAFLEEGLSAQREDHYIPLHPRCHVVGFKVGLAITKVASRAQALAAIVPAQRPLFLQSCAHLCFLLNTSSPSCVCDNLKFRSRHLPICGSSKSPLFATTTSPSPFDTRKPSPWPI